MNLKSEINEYLKIYQDNPRSRVFAPLAEAYRKNGLIDDAIEICKEGLSYHPNFTSGLVALSRSYFEKKEYTLAITELEKAIANTPDNYLAQKLLAESYFNIKDYQNALKTYKVLFFLDPKNYEYSKKISDLELLIKQNKKNSELKNLEDKKPLSEENIPVLPYNYDPVFTTEQESIISEEFDKNIDYCFEEKKLSTLFSEDIKIDDENVLQEFKTHTIAELLLEQGYKEKAFQVYKEILKTNPLDTIAREAIISLEKPKIKKEPVKEKFIENIDKNIEKKNIELKKIKKEEIINSIKNINKNDDNWLIKDSKAIKIEKLNKLIASLKK